MKLKLCKCGHYKKDHDFMKRFDLKKKWEEYCKYAPNCKCEKFQPEDEISDELKYDKDLWGKHTLTKQKKGSSEEKVWKDYLNHVKKKQKKGCVECDNSKFVKDEKGNYHHCPSCQNQSSYISVVDTSRPGSIPGKNTPEEDSLGVTRKESKVSNTDSSGTQSPIAMAEDKPVDTTNRNEAGFQSPRVKQTSKPVLVFHKPEDRKIYYCSCLKGEKRHPIRVLKVDEGTSTLSDKTIRCVFGGDDDNRRILYHEKDVKDFIQRLKKEFQIRGYGNWYLKKIDKLAGYKLLEGGKENENN